LLISEKKCRILFFKCSYWCWEKRYTWLPTYYSCFCISLRKELLIIL